MEEDPEQDNLKNLNEFPLLDQHLLSEYSCQQECQDFAVLLPCNNVLRCI